jgi:UDP-N-acetylmuramoyl-tripeptide--D-alanyl-D-alanine ligase
MIVATPIPPNRAPFTLDEIARATGGNVVKRAATEAIGATTDSRAVAPGNVFVALRGEAHDGHAFIPSAAERGAAIVIASEPCETDVSLVIVPDTLLAWGALARLHLERWRSPEKRVVAITGSSGKTTTKELAAALLARVAKTHRTPGNLNNRIGVPAVVLGLARQHRFAVLEMGMSIPGEIDAITAFARPDVSVIVNVGVAHAEGVGGREGVMREKGAIYRALSSDGIAIVNEDDAFVVRAAESARGERVTFGRSESATYRLCDRQGSRVVIAARERSLSIRMPLAGEAAAIDLCAALALQEAASGARLEPTAIEAALGTIRIDGRGSLVEVPDGPTILDDTYNANPSSMRASLATLAEIAGGRRRVAVLGEMKELGHLADEEHTSLGDDVADAGVALLIGCGGRIDLTLDRAAARGVEVARCPSTEAAAAEAALRVRPDDVVLVKGSRSVGAERVVAALARR